MELRKEYAGIVDAHVGGLSDIACERIELVALACQELADRPPRELTDAECREIYCDVVRKIGTQPEIVRAWAAAIHAKQREPQVVKFRAARHKSNGAIQLLPSDFVFKFGAWEWLDADGKAQEIEVRI